MNSLSDFQKTKRKALISFANTFVNPDAAKRDEECFFDYNLWKLCSQENLHSISMPSSVGGQDHSLVDTISILESMGYAFRDNGLSFGICAQLSSVSHVLSEDIDDHSFLKDIWKGETLVAHAISEISSGSDAFNMESSYEVTENGFLLKANKTYCSNLIPAKHVLLYAKNIADEKQISAFLISKDKLTEIVEIKKMGLNSCIMGSFKVNAEIPKNSLISKEGNGISLFNKGISLERLGMAAIHLGTIERLIEECVKWVREKKVGEEKLSDKQAITHPVTNLYERWSILRSALYFTCTQKLSFTKMFLQSCIFKDQVTQLYVDSCTQILQSYGALGYTKNHEIERMLRDAMASKIYSGSNEIQKEMIWKLF